MLPDIYPMYGYNSENHICQIKQASAQDDQNTSLVGEYLSLFECRIAHPEILFFTGQGIIWWVIILGACLVKYIYIAKKKKVSFQSVQGSCAFEIALSGSIFFIVFLFTNYFFGGAHPYYSSGIDAVLYRLAIHPKYPSILAVFYGAISFFQIMPLIRKRGA